MTANDATVIDHALRRDMYHNDVLTYHRRLSDASSRAFWAVHTCTARCALRIAVHCHDASTVAAVNKLDRQRVLLTTRSTCRGETFQVQSFGQSFR